MKNFWYIVGSLTGSAMKGMIYGIVIYGIAVSLWNREIPYLPVILFFTFHAWAKIVGIYDGVGYLLKQPQKHSLDTNDVERIVNIVNYRNMYGGSPN